MTYDDLYVLIPSHSLEDFPTEVEDEEAAALLNAFAVLWHPLLLAEADTTPSWHRSDEPPETLENRLVIIPSSSEEWLPGGWAGFAEKEGAVVLSGLHDRDELIARAIEPLESDAELNPDLVADFLALGTCCLMIELLTIHMHHFSNLDEVELQRDAIAAAKATVSGDDTAARAHLKTCFESLLEARERFYPVECFLVDLCLLIPRLADDNLERALTGDAPLNLLIGANGLQTIAELKPNIIALMREAWDGGRIDIAGGELHERPSPLLPLESVLWDFQQGQAVYQQLLGRVPKTWGRRKFGFSTAIPQILNKFGFTAALHIALDDGIYPDAEQSKIRWEGCDGTVIDAATRIPLAVNGAASYLRFPQTMGESMEMDHVAGVLFARWPEDRPPWFEDFQRIHAYAPVLGRFVTFEEFFENTDDPGRMSTYEAGEYLGPFLLQSMVYQEADPISRYREHLRRRIQLNDAQFFAATANLLCGERVNDEASAAIESAVELFGIDCDDKDESPRVPEGLPELASQSANQLAGVIMRGAGSQAGVLLLNSLGFVRRTVVELPQIASPPPVEGPIKGTHFSGGRNFVSVELPPCGFVWVSGAGGGTSSASGPPLAEEALLRNEFFEVWINEETGGIARIKGYGRVPNRLSQQLAFRFPEERNWTAGEGEQFKSYYSAMHGRSMKITAAGSLVGEIETTGDLIDQTDGSTLASFTQTFRIYRGLPYVDVEIELHDVSRMPDGDPWSNYIGCRWANNDMTASITRSVHQGAHGFRGQRFESLHYIEIATSEERTTICTDGNAFHRKTGNRMLDSILIVEGESVRRFRFRITVDVDYPLQPALDLMTPPTVVPTETGPPPFGPAGWFFHLDAKNVQVLKLMDVMTEPVDDGYVADDDNELFDTVPADELSDRDEADHEEGSNSGVRTSEEAGGFAIRLLETEGRSRSARLRCFRTPTSARQRDFQGRTISDLAIHDDCVIAEIGAYEIVDVEVRH